jgi:hypothetical protein
MPKGLQGQKRQTGFGATYAACTVALMALLHFVMPPVPVPAKPAVLLGCHYP